MFRAQVPKILLQQNRPGAAVRCDAMVSQLSEQERTFSQRCLRGSVAGSGRPVPFDCLAMTHRWPWIRFLTQGRPSSLFMLVAASRRPGRPVRRIRGPHGGRSGSGAWQRIIGSGNSFYAPVKLVTGAPIAKVLNPSAEAEVSMTRTEFFVAASSQDQQFIRRWSVRLPAFYGLLAVAIVAFSFVLHAPNDITAAWDTAKTQHAILVR
jgi:hypothetical protein